MFSVCFTSQLQILWKWLFENVEKSNLLSYLWIALLGFDSSSEKPHGEIGAFLMN